MFSHQKLMAKEIMHAGCTCVSFDQTIYEAAQMMASKGIGALPVCGPDEKLIGMLTDRDIVVRCIAKGLAPSFCVVGDIVSGPILWVRDTATASEVLAMMEEHKIRRLPVLDAKSQLCGIIAQSDIAECLGEAAVGEVVAEVSKGPALQHAT